MISLHIMNFCGLGEVEWWTHVMEWSFYFMSFFFFKAGYFNKGLKGKGTMDYIADRTRRIFIPYLSAGLIGMTIYFAFLPFLLDRYHKPIEPLAWEHIWQTSSFYGNRPTWFLFSFFVTYLAVYFIEKVRGLHWAVVLFPLAAYGLFLEGNPLWMDVNNVFMGIFFFYLGMLWRHAMNRFSRGTMLWVSVGMIALFIILNTAFHGEYTMSTNTFSGNFATTMLSMMLAICGLAGLLTSLNLPRVPGICYIGEHSMVYFISHYPMLYYYKFMHLSFGRSIWNKPDDVLILVPVIFGLCTWMVPFVERVPWLSGRRSLTRPLETPSNSPLKGEDAGEPSAKEASPLRGGLEGSAESDK